MTEPELVDFEIEVLRMLAGEEVSGVRGWGAALSAALEHLVGSGYASLQATAEALRYEITEKGRAFLLEHQGAKRD